MILVVVLGRIIRNDAEIAVSNDEVLILERSKPVLNVLNVLKRVLNVLIFHDFLPYFP